MAIQIPCGRFFSFSMVEDLLYTSRSFQGPTVPLIPSPRSELDQKNPFLTPAANALNCWGEKKLLVVSTEKVVRITRKAENG